MTRTPVESSNIAAVGYDATRRTLEVEFKPNKSGVAAVWQYTPVEPEAYDLMLQPGVSVGRVFFAAVKTNDMVTAAKVDEIASAPQ
jgi:hypothetical protein